MLSDASFREALEDCATTLARNFASSTRAQPEDQLKRPLQNLLEALQPGIVTRTEAAVAALGGRPDIAVDVRRLLTGHVELKAPGLGATPSRFRDAHSRAQFKKFKALPNLIYTDGNEWTLFRSGEHVARVRFSGDVTTDGAAAFDAAEAEQLRRLLYDFLQWEPIAPSTPRALAELLAPLSRMIRDDVSSALGDPASGLSQLAREWRDVLFPDADDAQFADAYAQTLTYALLLARFSGAEHADLATAERTLDSGHGLLAGALRILGSPDVRDEVGAGLDVLIRVIEAIDTSQLQGEGNDPWLYFYEHFLAAYDPRLRNNYGVYYTPPAVIGAQVRLIAELLETRFGKDLAFAADDVVVLDPATGTGAYPLAVIQHALDRAADFYGAGVRRQYASQLARNVHAFEVLVGPYAVAHLRITQKILEEGGNLPPDGAHVYLADTLESPDARDMEQHGFIYRRLTQEHQRARRVKKDQRVLVCLGNPPYDRQQRDEEDRERGIELQGGWVRFGDQSLNESRETNGILKDFVEPVVTAGQGVHLKNLYNLYVYFWRWALWKVFENVRDAGIVSFITAASYLRGPGFIGMRKHMRKTFDELWIIDLEGDNFGARRTENVFAIQTPVAIALGVRYGAPKPDEPASVHYTRLEGTRAEKLAQLEAVTHLASLEWRDCPTEWHSPFLPVGTGDYYSWPELTDIFPWQHSGAQFKRTWPIATEPSALEARWRALVGAPLEGRRVLFRETRDRRVDGHYAPLRGDRHAPSVASLPRDAACPEVTRYARRALDRQWVLADTRLGDYLRLPLWNTRSPRQVYLTSLLTKVLGLGPAAMVSAHPPDMDHFSGRGGKDVIPLWRDAEGTIANVTGGVLGVLNEALDLSVSPEDLFAYAYAVLASPAYVDRFSEELTLPGPRLPISRDADSFKTMADLGRKLIGWHTYGERFGDSAPQGTARNRTAVPTLSENYPETYRYDPDTRTLHVGEGAFEPVSPDVWGYSISGFRVVESWLGYRMRSSAGRSSSPLDDIRPERWSVDMTRELLELLWVLEATIGLWPALEERLIAIVQGPTFTAADFSPPTTDERSVPSNNESRVRIL